MNTHTHTHIYIYIYIYIYELCSEVSETEAVFCKTKKFNEWNVHFLKNNLFRIFLGECSPCDIVANELKYDIKESEFELQSHYYYVHF